jgi:hypothetical protein
MKTAYELAMERLSKTEPSVKLSTKQKQAIAELEAKYRAKVAEREIALKGEIACAAGEGRFEEVEKLEQQLASERQSFQSELQQKKEAVRREKR